MTLPLPPAQRAIVCEWLESAREQVNSKASRGRGRNAVNALIDGLIEDAAPPALAQLHVVLGEDVGIGEG